MIGAGAGRRFYILSGENRHVAVGLDRGSPGEGYCRPCVGRGASADRVNDEEHGVVLSLLEGRVDSVGRAQFLDPQAREFPTHRLHEWFWIGHTTGRIGSLLAFGCTAWRHAVPGPMVM